MFANFLMVLEPEEDYTAARGAGQGNNYGIQNRETSGNKIFKRENSIFYPLPHGRGLEGKKEMDNMDFMDGMDEMDIRKNLDSCFRRNDQRVMEWNRGGEYSDGDREDGMHSIPYERMTSGRGNGIWGHGMRAEEGKMDSRPRSGRGQALRGNDRRAGE